MRDGRYHHYGMETSDTWEHFFDDKNKAWHHSGLTYGQVEQMTHWIIGILFAAASDGPVRRAGAVRSHVFVRRRFCCAFAMVLERLWWAHSNNWWLAKEKED